MTEEEFFLQAIANHFYYTQEDEEFFCELLKKYGYIYLDKWKHPQVEKTFRATNSETGYSKEYKKAKNLEEKYDG